MCQSPAQARKKLVMRGLVVLAICVALVQAHSWIDCTDFKEVTAAVSYNNADCKARPRNWKNHAGGGVFGADTGYNFQGNTPDQCLYPLRAGVDVSSFYTAQYPMATYRQGQRVCLAWPAKNHVASSSCTNPFIPDTSNKLYISGANPTADPTSGWNLLKDWGNNPSGTPLESGGGKGFQNCPNFCANMDKALCGQCFDIPADLATGRYAFQWRWVFNAGTPPYTSCWDAEVVASGSTPTTTTTTAAPAPGAPTTTTTAAPATTARPMTGDSVRINNPPTQVELGSMTIPVTVQYSASIAVDIVVDFMSADYQNWYGKALQKNVPAGSGTLTLNIAVQNNPTQGPKVIKPWIVAAFKTDEQQAWAYELDNKQYTLSYGATNAPQPTIATTASPSGNGTLTTRPPSTTTKVVAGFTTVVLLITVFIFAV